MASNRNSGMCKGVRATAAAVALVAGSASSLGQATATFTGQCGSGWYDGCPGGETNWSGLPVGQLWPWTSDDAVIPSSVGMVFLQGFLTPQIRSLDCQSGLTLQTVLFVAEPSRIKNLVLNAGSITAGDTFTLDGNCVLHGNLSGSGAYLFLDGPHEVVDLNMDSGQAPVQHQNAAIIRINGPQSELYMWGYTGCKFINTAAGIIDMREGKLSVPLVNRGRITKMGGELAHVFGGVIESGQVDVLDGTLEFGSTRFEGGTVEVQSGATLELNGVRLAGLPAITGQGALTMAAFYPIDITGDVTLHLPAGATWTSFQGPATTRIGDATLTNAEGGEFIWPQVIFERVAGTSQGKIVNDGGITITPQSPSAVLRLDLYTNWSFSQHALLALQNGAKVINDGIMWLHTGDIIGGAGSKIVNKDVITRVADETPETCTIKVPLDMEAGLLTVEGSGLQPGADLTLAKGGTWSNASKAEVDLNNHLALVSGTYTFAGFGNGFSGGGKVTMEETAFTGPAPEFIVAAGGSLDLNMSGPPSNASTGFSFKDGVIDGPGLTRNLGNMTADGATIGLNGQGNFENEGDLYFFEFDQDTVSGLFRNNPDGTVDQSDEISLTEGTITNEGLWRVGVGQIWIDGGATFRNTGTLRAMSNELYVEGLFDNDGKVEVMPGGVAVFDGPVQQFANGALTGGEWIVRATGVLVLPGAITKIADGTLLVGNDQTVPDLAGIESVSGGKLHLNGDITLTEPNATLKIEGGGEVLIGPGAKLTAPGTIKVEPFVPVLSMLKGGLVISEGPSESFVETPLLDNGGAVVPGDEGEPGILDLTGAYQQRATGELWIELGGITPGMQHDVFEVSGQAALAGKLKVSLIDDFVPTVGDEFTVLTAGSIVGTFDTVELPALPVGREWEVMYNPGGEPWVLLRVTGECYPDCNQSGSLTIADFGCFQSAFADGDPYADCNGSSSLTIADFGCFQAKFAAGCP